MPVIETTENDLKERMSVGVVTLIAARAGCEVGVSYVDRMSRDVTISPIFGRSVSIDVQLKCTSNLIHLPDTVKFDLDVKNYNDLRATEVGNAQILIVVDLHDVEANWLNVDSDRLVFEKCAYWLSLYGRPPTNNTTRIRIDIPKAQVFTPASLTQIIERRFVKIQGNDGGL